MFNNLIVKVKQPTNLVSELVFGWKKICTGESLAKKFQS